MKFHGPTDLKIDRVKAAFPHGPFVLGRSLLKHYVERPADYRHARQNGRSRAITKADRLRADDMKAPP